MGHTRPVVTHVHDSRLPDVSPNPRAPAPAPRARLDVRARRATRARPSARSVRSSRSTMSARELARATVRAAERAASAPHALRVHIDNRYVYAQIVRRVDGHVVASASTIERAFDDANSSASSGGAIGEVREGRGATRAAGAWAKPWRRAQRRRRRRVRWHRPYGKRFHGKIKSLMDALVEGVGLM